MLLTTNLLLGILILSLRSMGETITQHSENQRPSLVSSSISTSFSKARTPIIAKALFIDAEGDSIVDVQISWRKVGTSGWSQKLMDYVLHSNPPEFQTEIIPTGEGQYEVEFRAADLDPTDSTKTILGKSKWAGRKTFSTWIPVRNNPPVINRLHVSKNSNGDSITIHSIVSDPDPEDSVVDVEVRWKERHSTTWQNRILKWVKFTASPNDFLLTTNCPPGTYHFEIRATDTPKKLVKSHRKVTTDWTPAGTFKVSTDSVKKIR